MQAHESILYRSINKHAIERKNIKKCIPCILEDTVRKISKGES